MAKYQHDKSLKQWLEEKAAEMRANPTRSEHWLEVFLEDNKLGVAVEYQVPKLHFILDAFVPEWNLAIELDGAPHRRYQASRDDKARDAALAAVGIKVVRIQSRLIFQSPQAVLRLIRMHAGVDMFPASEHPAAVPKEDRPNAYEQVFGQPDPAKRPTKFRRYR